MYHVEMCQWEELRSRGADEQGRLVPTAATRLTVKTKQSFTSAAGEIEFYLFLPPSS